MPESPPPEPHGKPARREKQGLGAMLIVLVAVIVIAPLVGAFAFSPLLVAWGIQPYPLAAALGVMIAEAIAVSALAGLILRSKR